MMRDIQWSFFVVNFRFVISVGPSIVVQVLQGRRSNGQKLYKKRFGEGNLVAWDLCSNNSRSTRRTIFVSMWFGGTIVIAIETADCLANSNRTETHTHTRAHGSRASNGKIRRIWWPPTRHNSGADHCDRSHSNVSYFHLLMLRRLCFCNRLSLMRWKMTRGKTSVYVCPWAQRQQWQNKRKCSQSQASAPFDVLEYRSHAFRQTRAIAVRVAVNNENK